MDVFEKSQPELLPFLSNKSKKPIKITRTDNTSGHINCLHMLLHGESLPELNALKIQNPVISNAHLQAIILSLLGYFLPTKVQSISMKYATIWENLRKDRWKYFSQLMKILFTTNENQWIATPLPWIECIKEDERGRAKKYTIVYFPNRWKNRQTYRVLTLKWSNLRQPPIYLRLRKPLNKSM